MRKFQIIVIDRYMLQCFAQELKLKWFFFVFFNAHFRRALILINIYIYNFIKVTS